MNRSNLKCLRNENNYFPSECQNRLTLKSKEIVSSEEKIKELSANIQSLNNDIESCITETKQKECHLKSMQKEFEQKQADLKRLVFHQPILLNPCQY